MRTARALYQLMLADFLERIRRYSFLIVLVVTVMAGYSMVPSVDAPYNAFAIGVYRPFYSSAWVGTVFGMVITTLVTLLGFFLVRNAVPRDYQTRVGQIIATTPISKPLYMLGKWLSNLAVLSSILVVLTVVALVMQLVRAEDLHVDLWALAAPIWLMGLPPLALVAALSILFECVSMPSGLGNILFGLAWLGSVVVFTAPIIDLERQPTPSNDLFGFSGVMADIRSEMISQGLDPTAGVADLYQPTGGRQTQRFVWKGVAWNLRAISERSFWMALAVLLALTASIPFDRFDPARSRTRRRGKKHKGRAEILPDGQTVDAPASLSAEFEPAPIAEDVSLTPLALGTSHNRFWTTAVTELVLMVKGRSLWWYAGTLGLNIAALATPGRTFQGFIVPFLWLWPIFLWSAMGSQETRNRTNQFVFPVADLVKRQLPAIWLAGCLLASTATAGAALRLLIGGEWGQLLGWIVASMFIPALALTLGVWTNGGRVFEIFYFVLWLVAVKHPPAVLNFMGRSDEPSATLVPLIYIVVTVVLLLLAAAGRRRQIVSSLR